MLIRTRAFIYFTLFFILCLFSVVIIGNIQTALQIKHQEAAQKKVRQQWENLEPMNPHGAAHYGSYAFKPLNNLNSLDGGINDITGNVIKLEGHVQNEVVYSEASQSISISRFGKLRASILLQYVIPMIIIFFAFSSITNERKSGRVKLLLIQGVLINKLILA